MGYMHITNLYKDQDVLLLKECYAMEKIHGTSAHVQWRSADSDAAIPQDPLGYLSFFSGGERHENFMKLFPEEFQQKMKEGFARLGHDRVVVYGEAYGGKCQGMKATYGDQLRFVAFEVQIGEWFVSVPQAHKVATDLGFDFVHYERGPATIEWLDAQRDADSVQAVKNGMGEGHKREGIVIRPILELRKNNDERLIAKHKSEAFSEFIKTPRVQDNNREVQDKAEEIALQWVTPMRLNHVIDSIGSKLGIGFDNVGLPQTRQVIEGMIEDVERESAGEFEMTREIRKTVGANAARLFKQYIQNKFRASDV